MRTLQISRIGGGGKYLGLPEQFGRRKKEMFQSIHGKIKKKLQGWQTKFLTPAGKETLIKAVAYAMPVYSMNVFQLPKELCSDIDSMIARFWWGSTPEKRKISWVAWKKLVTTKNNGGLGFRDLHLFNQALLANQVWKIIQRPKSLVYRILKARYFKDGNIFTATKGGQPSYGWNSLRFGRELLHTGIQFSIGDGKTTKLGTDPWLPTLPPRAPKLLPETNPDLFVDSIIDRNNQQWNEIELHRFIEPEDHYLIRKIFLPQQATPDSFIWHYTKDGRYTVKSGYWQAITSTFEEGTPKPPLATTPDIASNIWKLDIAPKLKHFLWRVASRAIGVSENLRRRNMNVNPYCSRCCSEFETTNHTLFTCSFVQVVWRSAGIPTHQLCDPSITVEEKFRYLFNHFNDIHIPKITRSLPFWLMWRIWKSRNDLIFNRKSITQSDTLNQAINDTKEWLENRPQRESSSARTHQCLSRRERWTPPPRGWIKCNYDASHREGDSASGLGWIIRDSTGTFMDCGMGQFQGRTTIEEAECTALLWAIQATWALGYRAVVFEGDNLNINRLINDNVPTPRLRHFLETIWHWRPMFTETQFIFHHREQNTCADLLAKTAITSNKLYNVYHSCPNFLKALVNNDVNNSD